MRKWLGIGLLSVAVVGVGAYGFYTQTNGWITRRGPDVENVRGQHGKSDGDAEPSDVIEPLIVQRPNDAPAPAEVVGGVVVELARVVLEPGMPQPPRPDVNVEPGTERMPYADEELGIGVWFFLDWSAIKAKLSKLDIFKEIEKADPTEESENKETNPPAEPVENPPADPVPDYHQQYPHCPYHGPCPTPYRSMPRD
jgi:hypothetical protein